MKIAYAVAAESKCVSVQVGAVLVKDDRVIATGYNGTPKGQPNCCDVHKVSDPELFLYEPRTMRYLLLPAGREKHHAWSKKNEIHAELNVILFAARNGIETDGATLYCTLTPCGECAKALAASGIKRVVYHNVYDKNDSDWDDIMEKAGIKVEQIEMYHD